MRIRSAGMMTTQEMPMSDDDLVCEYRLDDGQCGYTNNKLLCGGFGNCDYPFRSSDAVGTCWLFFYYDPLYDIKLAWKQGKQIQTRWKDSSMDWKDVDSPDWTLGEWVYRVKPEDTHKLVFASNGCISLDIENVPCIVYTGTKQQCIDYAFEKYCNNCIHKLADCTVDSYCMGFKPEKKWRPFKDVDELKKVWSDKRSPLVRPDIEEPMIWVKEKQGSRTIQIRGFDYTNNWIYAGRWCTFEALFNAFEFLDDTPCGVDITDEYEDYKASDEAYKIGG